MTKILLVAFISELAWVAAGQAAPVPVFENDFPVIRIIDKDYISYYIEWDFEPLGNDSWYANFVVRPELYEDAKKIFSTPSTHKKWQDFADKWFDDPDDMEDPNGVVIAENIKSLWALPRTADPEEMIFSDIDWDMNTGSGTFVIYFPNGFDVGYNASFGFGTTTVATGNSGDGNYEYAWNKRVVFDPFCKRWHVFAIDSGSDLHSWSAPASDTTSWTSGGDIDIGTYDMEDFDVVLDLDAGQSYVHIIYTTSSSSNIYYRRISLDCTSDYTSAGSEQSVDSTFGSFTFSDHADHPSIGIDDDDCVMFMVDWEDDSEATGDEHHAWLTKEDQDGAATFCGDGIWVGQDYETGFPVIVQDEAGYNADLPTGIIQYDDPYTIDGQSGDLQLLWFDTDSSGGYQLETKFWDESAGSLGTQRTLDSDAESSQGEWPTAAVMWDVNFIAFGMDDGTNDVDAYRIESLGGALSDQTDTGLNVKFGLGNYPGVMTAIVDLNSTDEDDIYVFGAHNNDEDDLYFSNTTDGGDTWNGEVMWIDEAVSSGIQPEYLSSWFWNCTAMVTWMDNADIIIDTLDTCGGSGGGPPADSCTYDSGDWEIDCSDWCQVTAVTDMETNKLICTGSGEVYINAEVTYGSFVIGDGCKVVLGSDGKMVQK